MANAIYPKYKQSLLNGDANTALTGSGTTGLYAALVDKTTYTYSAAHQFYSDLSGIGGTDQEITSPTLTGGVIDGGDVAFPAVAAGNALGAIVLYRKNAGANTTWRLVAYIDTSITGMPVTPNGGDIDVTWNASGIVAL